MANEIFPDEGLDYLLGITPKNGTNLTNTYCGLFINMSASTTPAASAILSSQTGVTESSGWGYARQAHAASAWGAAGTATIWGQANARRVVGAQLTFAAASAAYAAPINGFFMAATSGLGTGPALFYSNFDDTTAIASLSLGDIIKVTPTWGLLG
jgi:hypothetical protein